MTTPCDLCGHREFTSGTRIAGRAMLSDRRAVAVPLVKERCARCGLIRGDRAGIGDLQRFYTDDYQQAGQGDHLFYTVDGPIARADVVASWLTRHTANDWWTGRPRVLEIGCGNGATLASMARLRPQARFEGLEPNEAAAAEARARGIAVTTGHLADLPPTSFDGAFAFAVLEHVTSPMAFLREIRARLTDSGWLVLAQPTQDVASYDVLFLDHLHHFATAHLRHYASATGFVERTADVGHPLMPNFSLHAWQCAPMPRVNPSWDGPAAHSASAAAIASLNSDFAKLDALLDDLSRRGRRVAVFGVAEAFSVLCAYTTLAPSRLVCGMSDPPWPPRIDGLPVRRPEDAIAELGVEDVLLTMNRVHYPVARARLAPLGVQVHEVFSQAGE